MNTNEIGELSGVSVRTLHHYDKISLLSPRRNPENGYREYTNADIDKLQQIMFFKSCGFSLIKIKELLCSPTFDRENTFALQKKVLLHEKKRIDTMLNTLEKSIQNMKGEIIMSQNDKFIGFDMKNNPYEEEARHLWGNEIIDKSKVYISSLPKEEQNAISKGLDDLFVELAKIRHENPCSEIAQQAMGKMYATFNANFGHNYTPESFAGVGQMYICDERFKTNVDQYGEGLSSFLAEAMQIYSENHN